MSALDWLDVLPPTPRRLLLGGTGISLAAASLLLDPLSVPPEHHTPIAAGVAGVVGLGWGLAWLGLARPALQRRQRAAEASAEDRARDRGLLAKQATKHRRTSLRGDASLIESDPGFCLPAFLDAVVALHTAAAEVPITCGPASVEVVRWAPDRTRVDVLVGYARDDRTPRAARITVSRPPDASSPPPDAQGSLPEGAWALDQIVELDALPPPALAPAPGLAAARRALLLRAEAFDLDGFEALIAEINDALDGEDATTGALEAYTTPGGLRAVRWWQTNNTLPTTDTEITWLEVEEDGWYERIEIRCGDRLLGLLRPSGQPDAPWQLWRLRGVV